MTTAVWKWLRIGQPGRRQRDGDGDRAVARLLDRADHAELDDVLAQLGVDDGAQGLEDLVAGGHGPIVANADRPARDAERAAGEGGPSSGRRACCSLRRGARRRFATRSVTLAASCVPAGTPVCTTFCGLGDGHVGALRERRPALDVARGALDVALDAGAALAQLALDARAGLLDVALEAVDGAAATALELLQLALGLLRRAVAAADLDDAVAGDQDGADGGQHGALDGLLRLRGDLLDLRADLGHAAVEATLGGLGLGLGLALGAALGRAGVGAGGLAGAGRRGLLAGRGAARAGGLRRGRAARRRAAPLAERVVVRLRAVVERRAGAFLAAGFAGVLGVVVPVVSAMGSVLPGSV